MWIITHFSFRNLMTESESIKLIVIFLILKMCISFVKNNMKLKDRFKLINEINYFDNLK